MAAVLGLSACKGDETPPRTQPATPTPPAADAAAGAQAGAATTPTADATPSDAHERLLEWLDPEAIALAWIADTPVTRTLDEQALAVVYGLPTDAEELLKASTDLDDALAAMQPTDAPAIDTWLGHTTMVTKGRLSQYPTVLRVLAAPRETAVERLEAMEMRREDADPFEVWRPHNAFPYRVALLEREVAAFIHVREPGSGTTALASARDMPPSPQEDQLAELLGGPKPPAIALFASGNAMLHFDLSQDVIAVRFELYADRSGALDGQVAMQVADDPAKAVQELRARKAPEQSDRIQEVMTRTAYATNGPVVEGRLQLPAADVDVLSSEP